MASTSLVNGLFFFALCGTALAATQEVVPVTVYFESYCPDSVKFLTKQLYPIYLTELRAYMNVMLVPYGKATMTKSDSGDYTFSCHHGEKECVGNKVIACVLKDRDSSLANQLKFINCTSSVIAANTKQEDYPVQECASPSSFKADTVLGCAGETTGSEYLAEYGNKTNELSPALTSVPTVVFNEKYMASESKMAVNDFRKALCSKISGTKPAECLKSGAATLHAAIIPVLAALVAITRV